jgi:hypothetical protein
MPHCHQPEGGRRMHGGSYLSSIRGRLGGLGSTGEAKAGEVKNTGPYFFLKNTNFTRFLVYFIFSKRILASPGF